MKFKDYILGVGFNEIKERIEENFELEPKKIDSYTKGFSIAHQIMKAMKPKETDAVIEFDFTILDENEDAEFVEVEPIIVYNNGQTSSFDFIPWEEVLGMEVQDIEDEDFDAADVVFMVMFEMTEYGFTPRQVRNNYMKIFGRLPGEHSGE